MTTHDALTIGPVTAAPGQIASGHLTIAPAAGDHGTIVPFSIVRGRQPGPVLVLAAGIHGMEYVPIAALQRLRASIDPSSIRGTVLMIHAANMPSFLGRTIYYSPIDGKNLNRVFPGRPDGTISERIADAITREFVGRATHLIDLHGGDGNESLRPYSYWITTGAPDVTEASRALAVAFGLDRIVVDTERPTDPAASMYLSNTAVTRGVPAITTEIGGLARVDEDAVALLLGCVGGAMRHLGLTDNGSTRGREPVWIEHHAVLRAKQTGLFEAAVECGAEVAAGTLLGRITGFDGRVLEEIRAPLAGEVLYIIRTPPITTGEPVGMVGAGSTMLSPRR